MSDFSTRLSVPQRVKMKSFFLFLVTIISPMPQHNFQPYSRYFLLKAEQIFLLVFKYLKTAIILMTPSLYTYTHKS